jgi:glycosyltransferase involved in cell wall biosynthesis
VIGVLMLVNEFSPLPTGGAEKQAECLAERLGKQGFRVGVLTRGMPGLPGREQRDGYWIERVPQRGPGKLKALTFMLGAVWAVWKRRHEIDILHAHLAFAPALVAALMGRVLNKPVVVKFGTSGPYGDVRVSQRTWRGRLRLALLRRWVDVSIALSAEMEAEMLEAGFPRERVRRISNGVDADVFRPCHDKQAEKLALGLPGNIVALFVGRLAPQKAVPVLLHAWRRAVDECSGLQLVLLGDGPDRHALERMARQLAIDAHVTFAGHVPDVRRYLAAADMFALPSASSEGISNALLEAMASGVACIATAVGGSSEVLDNGNTGILLPSDRPDLLSEAIVRLVRHPDEAARYGERARSRILAHYSFAVVEGQYRAVYEQLLHRETLSQRSRPRTTRLRRRRGM